MGYHPVIVSVEQLPSYFSSHSMDTPYHLFLKFIPYVCVFGCCASSWVLSFLIRISKDKLSSRYVNARYKRDGNSYIIISCLILFGEEPSVLSSSSLCDCTKLGNENLMCEPDLKWPCEGN